MQGIYKNKFHQKTIYLAIALSLQAGSALADEVAPKTSANAAEALEEVTVKSKKEAYY